MSIHVEYDTYGVIRSALRIRSLGLPEGALQVPSGLISREYPDSYEHLLSTKSMIVGDEFVTRPSIVCTLDYSQDNLPLDTDITIHYSIQDPNPIIQHIQYFKIKDKYQFIQCEMQQPVDGPMAFTVRSRFPGTAGVKIKDDKKICIPFSLLLRFRQ